MKFRVLLHRKADEFLRGLEPENRQRIAGKLKDLEDFPKVRLDIVKIAGEANTFRLLKTSREALEQWICMLFVFGERLMDMSGFWWWFMVIKMLS